MKELELRMYFFVPYNLSEIQKGIQAGHAAMEYARIWYDRPQFIDFTENHKTWIILNGGTTNNCLGRLGSLQETHMSIIEWNRNNVNNCVDLATFHEPDLNDAMSAFCFICDERVFNKKDYPSKEDFMLNIDTENMSIMDIEEQEQNWVNLIGGEKNIFLRELLKGKRLA